MISWAEKFGNQLFPLFSNRLLTVPVLLPHRYAPLGILFLIAGKIVEMEDMGVIGGQLAMYTLTVIVGLLIHAVIVLPLLYFFVTRKNPWVFIGGLLQALITALGTSSRYVSVRLTPVRRCVSNVTLNQSPQVQSRGTRWWDEGNLNFQVIRIAFGTSNANQTCLGFKECLGTCEVEINSPSLHTVLSLCPLTFA